MTAAAGPPVDFGAAVAEVVRSIPAGRVMTYGDVAAVLGSRASRAVGKVMAHEGADLPWWRVVRSGGYPPLRHEAPALEHYRVEGTPLLHGASAWRLDMRRARWSPEQAARPGPVGADPSRPADGAAPGAVGGHASRAAGDAAPDPVGGHPCRAAVGGAAPDVAGEQASRVVGGVTEAWRASRPEPGYDPTDPGFPTDPF